MNKSLGYETIVNHNYSVICAESTRNAMYIEGAIKATIENHSEILERARENITRLQERLLIPTTQFSEYGIVDTSNNRFL